MSAELVSRFIIPFTRIEPGDWGAVNLGQQTLSPRLLLIQGTDDSTQITRADVVFEDAVVGLWRPDALPRRSSSSLELPQPLRAWVPNGSLLLRFEGKKPDAICVLTQGFGER